LGLDHLLEQLRLPYRTNGGCGGDDDFLLSLSEKGEAGLDVEIYARHSREKRLPHRVARMFDGGIRVLEEQRLSLWKNAIGEEMMLKTIVVVPLCAPYGPRTK
jgi:hypothetical protein